MNIVYIGSSGSLSVVPLRFLILSSQRPVAVAVVAGSGDLLQSMPAPVIACANESVDMLAAMNRIPVIPLFDVNTDYLEEIIRCKPDVIIVSCLHRKLPDTILAIPRFGCFNLHPSLLPAFRGPVPLFWQFREGVRDFGMSLHRMTAAFDAGPVVAQKTLNLPDGITNEVACERLAELAVILLETFLTDLEQDKTVTGVAQDEASATAMGYPQASDFEVFPSWTARRIFNFMRATQHWGQNYPCRLAGRSYALREALSFNDSESGSATAVIEGETIVIPCSRGSLTASFVSQHRESGVIRP